MSKIRELEGIASLILKNKKLSRPRRPIVIEFCGTPKSGKTACLSSLNLFLKRNGFSTKLLAERASVCPIGDKFSPFFNIWTSNSAIAELVATFAEEGKSLDVIISDRGIFDALCWFEWLFEHDHMKANDYQVLKNYLTTDRLRSMVDLVYLLKATPKIAMQREYAHLLTRKHGSIMNNAILQQYNDSIDKAISQYKHSFRCVRKIDTSKLLQNEVSYQVTKDVLQTLYNLIAEKVAYIKRDDLRSFEMKTYWDFSAFQAIPSLNYGPRDEVENDSSLVQPVPVLVITNKARDKVLVVKKKAQSLREGSPEKDKLLVYMGGHIREEDNLHGPKEKLTSIASTTLSREILEELTLSINVKDNNPLCIWIKNNSHSERHLALVHLYEADLDYLSYRLDDYEFIQTTGKSKSGRILPIAGLEPSDMEDWSKIILSQKVGTSIPGLLPFDK